MEKPKKPIEPKVEDYPTPKEPNAKNVFGEPLYLKLDYVIDYKQYEKDLEKYKADIEKYEQLKFIKIIKNATETYCLKSFKIIKK